MDSISTSDLDKLDQTRDGHAEYDIDHPESAPRADAPKDMSSREQLLCKSRKLKLAAQNLHK